MERPAIKIRAERGAFAARRAGNREFFTGALRAPGQEALPCRNAEGKRPELLLGGTVFARADGILHVVAALQYRKPGEILRPLDAIRLQICPAAASDRPHAPTVFRPFDPKIQVLELLARRNGDLGFLSCNRVARRALPPLLRHLLAAVEVIPAIWLVQQAVGVQRRRRCILRGAGGQQEEQQHSKRQKPFHVTPLSDRCAQCFRQTASGQ